MNKLYQGNRKGNKVTVTVDSLPLPPCTNLRNHSPDGFNWGYAGSGPAQLALALLVDVVGNKRALRFYQDFKLAIIAHLHEDTWILSEYAIRRWVEKREEGEI